ncbi:hypothetical protein FJZ40_04545 [Candidatus Shapirobacteria bacterium]|nr:hypothetical protein [Candidatus Shapirobacteria bacterium]
MKRYAAIIVSCLVFFVGLFLFRAIFLALGLTLFFLLIWSLLEAVWYFRDSPVILGLANLCLAAILALAIYSLVFLPVEFLTTEILLITPKVSSWGGLGFLGALVLWFSLVNLGSILVAKKEWRWSLVSLLAISFLVYGFWRHFKLEREYWPKVYSFVPKEGIQAEIVSIRGVNFFPVWKRGKVILGAQEMVILDWNEELIVAEQPVPYQFGKVDLYVVRSDGRESNKVSYEVEDPGKLGRKATEIEKL